MDLRAASHNGCGADLTPGMTRPRRGPPNGYHRGRGRDGSADRGILGPSSWNFAGRHRRPPSALAPGRRAEPAGRGSTGRDRPPVERGACVISRRGRVDRVAEPGQLLGPELDLGAASVLRSPPQFFVESPRESDSHPFQPRPSVMVAGGAKATPP